MKKSSILLLAAMLIFGISFSLTGCVEFLEALAGTTSSYSSSSYSSSSDGCPNGSCHVFADEDANGSYDVCSRSSCAASSTPYPVPANTNVYCNCK